MMEKFISIPVLPVTSLEELPARLEDFYTKLCNARPTHSPSPKAEAQALLLYCSVQPPLPRHPTHILGDINSSFSDLLDKISTPQGQEILQDYAGEVANRVIQFWTTEFC